MQKQQQQEKKLSIVNATELVTVIYVHVLK